MCSQPLSLLVCQLSRLGGTPHSLLQDEDTRCRRVAPHNFQPLVDLHHIKFPNAACGGSKTSQKRGSALPVLLQRCSSHLLQTSDEAVSDLGSPPNNTRLHYPSGRFKTVVQNCRLPMLPSVSQCASPPLQNQCVSYKNGAEVRRRDYRIHVFFSFKCKLCFERICRSGL